MADEIKYVYPIEELDKVIEQMNQGISVMVPSDMMKEVKIRYKQIKEELFGEDDEEEEGESFSETVKRHNEEIQKHIENEKNKATRKDVVIMTISEETKARIRDEMSEVYVRSNPNDDYNKSDEEVFKNTNRKALYEKLKGLKNCYYNQKDYVNAINIIKEAIQVSLGKYGDGDYPYMTYEEALDEFNKGRIKFKWCEIPKLYINHSTIITDRDLLKGIISGEIELRNRRDDASTIKKKPKRKSEGVVVEYNTISEERYKQMFIAHKQGYDTDASVIIRHKSSTYDPKAIPIRNKLLMNNSTNNDTPMLHDWEREGAGKEYFDMTHGVKQSTADILRYVDKLNDSKLGQVLLRNAQEFLTSMKYSDNNYVGYDNTLPNYIQAVQGNNTTDVYNNTAAQIEQELLNSISINNINK